jgi:hypothetical protein
MDFGSCTLNVSGCNNVVGDDLKSIRRDGPRSSIKIKPNEIISIPLLLHTSREIDYGWTAMFHSRPLDFSEVKFMKKNYYKFALNKNEDNNNSDIEEEVLIDKNSVVWINIPESNMFIDFLSNFRDECVDAYGHNGINIVTTTVYPTSCWPEVMSDQLRHLGNAKAVPAPILILMGACTQNLISQPDCKKGLVAVVHFGNFESMAWFAIMDGLEIKNHGLLFPEAKNNIDINIVINQINSNLPINYKVDDIVNRIVNILSIEQVSHLILSGKNAPSEKDFKPTLKDDITIINADQYRMHIGACSYTSFDTRFFSKFT